MTAKKKKREPVVKALAKEALAAIRGDFENFETWDTSDPDNWSALETVLDDVERYIAYLERKARV